MKNHFANCFLALLILTLCSCDSSSQSWKSKYYDLTAEYFDPWTLVIPPIDTKERTMFSVMDRSDGTLYMVEMTTESLYKGLTDKEYYEELIKRYLAEAEGNKFLKAEEVEFHGDSFHMTSFLMNNPKFGLMKLYDFVKRENDLVIGVILAFPVNQGEVESIKIPERLIELDKKIKIRGN